MNDAFWEFALAMSSSNSIAPSDSYWLLRRFFYG
jgi:hypothetical protein